MRAANIDQDAALNTVSCLVYGDSGVGKTTSLRTLPQASTVVAVSERSAIPLRGTRFAGLLQLGDWEDVELLYTAFANPQSLIATELEGQIEAIENAKCLAIDSLSELSDMCIRHIVRVDRPEMCKERSKNRSTRPQNTYEDQMGLEDWGLYRTRMLNMISAFCHLPIHIVVTCLATWLKDKAGNDTFRTPNLGGKSSRECAAYFDCVLHMEGRTTDGKPERVWRTATDGMIVAKDASGLLDPFEETDWSKLFGKLLNNGKAQG